MKHFHYVEEFMRKRTIQKCGELFCCCLIAVPVSITLMLMIMNSWPHAQRIETNCEIVSKTCDQVYECDGVWYDYQSSRRCLNNMQACTVLLNCNETVYQLCEERRCPCCLNKRCQNITSDHYSNDACAPIFSLEENRSSFWCDLSSQRCFHDQITVEFLGRIIWIAVFACVACIALGWSVKIICKDMLWDYNH
jgi:hypothetical protein